MTEARRIQLHLGKCIEDLDKLHNVPELKTKRATLLCKTAQKLLESAEDSRSKGDEEYSYVYYMKYLRVVAFLSKDKEYLKDKAYFTNMLGAKNPTKALDAAEKLKISLIERYSREQKVKRLNDIKENELIKQKIDENRKKAMEIMTVNEPIPPVGLPDPERRQAEGDDPGRSLGEGLHRLAHQPPRLHQQSANVLEQALPSESRPVWAQRASMELIVLLDWSSATVIPGKTLMQIILDKQERIADNSLSIEKQRIEAEQDWEKVHKQREIEPQDDVRALYEMREQEIVSQLMQLENKQYDMREVHRQREIEPQDDVRALYEMREQEIFSQLMQLENKQYDMREVHRQREIEPQDDVRALYEMLEQEIFSQLMQLENKQYGMREVHRQREIEPQDDVRALYEMREQEIVSQLMQLENKQYGMEQENQSLREQLEDYQRKEREEASKLADSLESEATPSPEAQEETQRRVSDDEGSDAYMVSPSDSPGAHGMNRSHSSPNIAKQISSDEEEVSTPAFDRNTKPIHSKVAPSSDLHHRDFQPLNKLVLDMYLL
ncbi:Ubiquitin carboxyl-terminal hydrolase [Operophtera brumata]|uniref:Ubiquitin carboxyl-terminal hydrolase n=1 Tax=Operophtera brumata TaxID=104452 RepID=A0A0L7LUQ0_OPEBR|nr:Ubiquitin carboxyl-terminal hydrolase [Operophtera brumata]